MKIKSLTIKNFKAFYGEYNFDFCDSNGKVENIFIKLEFDNGEEIRF